MAARAAAIELLVVRQGTFRPSASRRGARQPILHAHHRRSSTVRPSLLEHRHLLLKTSGYGGRVDAGGRRATVCQSTATADSSVSHKADAGEVQNVVIIGSGPAGYTAAIYAARANLRPLVFEGLEKGLPGGQLMTTTEVENFPGFPEGITGPDLMDRMRQQAERWGAVTYMEDVLSIDLSVRPFRLVTSGGHQELRASSIILATGASARRLGIPSEAKFWSNGISACAICDGASPIFKGQTLAVVGGGDSAAEEAVYLTKYASHVHLLVRDRDMRASRTMQDRVMAHSDITVHFSTTVTDAFGDPRGRLAGLHLMDSETQEMRQLEVSGMFYAIGHRPNSELVRHQVDTTMSGYVITKDARTSVEGVFACGDLQDMEWRQAVTAAGSGCMAAIAAERYLAENDLLVEYHQKVEVEAKPVTAEVSISAGAAKAEAVETKATFDWGLTEHRGQYALRKLYHESDRLLGVLYTSPTCGPCRILKPILKKVVAEHSSDMHLVEIDIEEDPEIAMAAGVVGTPCMQFFKAKDKIGEMKGVKRKSEYREFIKTHA
mmetsp:Transcript_4871/g.17661  ORF Transcript_4871/g.17661 Transcript_4871/m.17661 type:complete len:550 (-) Transcript_4871:196-1845(-)